MYDEDDHCMCGGDLNYPEGCYADGHVPCSAKEYYNQTKKEKTMTTNYSTAVMLFNENIRAIAVSYDPVEFERTKQTWVYKTLDQTVSEGDFVVIPTDTRHKFTVVRVEYVDVEVDFEDDTEIKWIGDRVDTCSFDEIKEKENEWIGQMKKAQVRKKKEDLKKSMIDMYADEGITTAAIVHMGSEEAVAIEAVKDEE